MKWRDGTPFIRTAVITRVTTSTYQVDGIKASAAGWKANWQEAIEDEFEMLFRHHDLMLGKTIRPDDWSVADTVKCVCQVRRLQRKLQVRLKG